MTPRLIPKETGGLVFEKDVEGEQMGEALAGPELATGFETVLELSAEGFNRAAAHGGAFIFPCLVVNVILVVDDVLDLACHGFLGWRAAWL